MTADPIQDAGQDCRSENTRNNGPAQEKSLLASQCPPAHAGQKVETFAFFISSKPRHKNFSASSCQKYNGAVNPRTPKFENLRSFSTVFGVLTDSLPSKGLLHSKHSTCITARPNEEQRHQFSSFDLLQLASLTMKVLLRNTQTGLLYAGPGAWTQDYSAALSFPDMNSALDCVSESQLSGIEVLMHFENPAYEIPLTIVGSAV